MALKKVAILCIGFLFLLAGCSTVNIYPLKEMMIEDTLVRGFYVTNNQQLYWFSCDKNIKRANDWLATIKASDNLGIVSDQLQIKDICNSLINYDIVRDTLREKIDKQITGLVLHFLKDLQQGDIKMDYDEVSIERDSIYIAQLINTKSSESVSEIVARLDCKDHDYAILKNYLRDSITVKDTLKYKSIILAMNYRRYLTINCKSEYIFVNILTTEAEYYRNDSLLLKMRTVVGRKSKPTPVIASYITDIVTFPAWNVPYSIAVKEILPKVQENADYLEKGNFEVVDSSGVVIEDSELKWEEYNSRNFPYYFRQSTGAENALGVLKFEMQNPFSIFLHATSSPGTFSRDYRFLSHGCIRLEKPFELAETLMRGKIDIENLKSGKGGTPSSTINLPHKIATFIIYMPATVVGENVVFFPDVYNLIK